MLNTSWINFLGLIQNGSLSIIIFQVKPFAAEEIDQPVYHVLFNVADEMAIIT